MQTSTGTAVLAQQGLQFVPDLDLVCQESRRVLLGGGRVVAGDSVPAGPWRAGDPADREAWVTQFGAGLAARSRGLTAVLTVAVR